MLLKFCVQFPVDSVPICCQSLVIAKNTPAMEEGTLPLLGVDSAKCTLCVNPPSKCMAIMAEGTTFRMPAIFGLLSNR